MSQTYHDQTVPVGTRIPRQWEPKVKQLAAQAGVTLAEWLRRVVKQELQAQTRKDASA